jgi:hypothetical protein
VATQARFVFEAEPGAQVCRRPLHRPGLLLPGGELRLVALGSLAGRDLHASPDPVQQQIQPSQCVIHPNLRCISSAIRASVQHWSSQPRRPGRCPARPADHANWAADSFQRAPPGPFDVKACRPPAARAPPRPVGRHPHHLKPPGHLRSLAPASISSEATNRTCSRRVRASAVSPPPSGFLMPSASRTAHRLSPFRKPAIKNPF